MWDEGVEDCASPMRRLEAFFRREGHEQEGREIRTSVESRDQRAVQLFKHETESARCVPDIHGSRLSVMFLSVKLRGLDASGRACLV